MEEFLEKLKAASDNAKEIAIQEEIIELKSANMFFHGMLCQIKAAIAETANGGPYDKELLKILRIILAPFDGEDEEEENEVEDDAE